MEREIYSGIITLNHAFEKQINLKNEIDKFNEFTKPNTLNKKSEKVLTYKNADRLLKERRKVLNGYESKIFPIEKQTLGKERKVLTPNEILQGLKIALAQVEAGNTSKNVLLFASSK